MPGDPAVITADTSVPREAPWRRTYQDFRRGIVTRERADRGRRTVQFARHVYMHVRASSPMECEFTNARSASISLIAWPSLRLASRRPSVARAWLWSSALRRARAAFAVGEEITDVRVLGNQRTEESTVRSIAGVSIGDTLELDTLDMVRERLNTTGLFADVNVWWEQHGTGVRVNISVKDKFPWAPVPTGSWSANNKSFGLLFVHGNLFGRGKQLLIGGRLATSTRAPRSPTAIPRCSAAGSTGSCRASCSARSSPSTTRLTAGASRRHPSEFRETPPRSRTASSRRSASPGSGG